MALLIHNLALGLDEPEDLLTDQVVKKLRVDPDQVRAIQIVRKSLDARPRHQRWIYSVAVHLKSGQRRLLRKLASKGVRAYDPPAGPTVQPGEERAESPPIVVGAGPAGMFAALLLAEAGYRPIVLDRGRDVDVRDTDVSAYVSDHNFNPESNFLFGEGGAGTYSDGKLYTRTHDPLGAWVLEQFVACGADADIAINGKPHVGSDRLPGVVANLRRSIEALGGQFRYSAQVTDVELADGKLTALTLADGERLTVSAVLLGIGHSARDTYAMLARRGVRLSAKPFQMGLRIEHPQKLIDASQLGTLANRPDIGPADYHLVAKGAAGDGDVYTFCMCPGGAVLPANNQAETICTNGGSRRDRDSGRASSAMVMAVRPDRFGDDPLAGLALQERIERACFAAAGGDYALAAQRADDFVLERATIGSIDSGSLTGARGCDFNTLLPDYLCKALHAALPVFAQRIDGFAGPDALLLGPETRASGPVRIDRDRETRVSVSADNLYPIGEGAGFAGGIVSAAVDALRSAEAVIRRFAPTEG